MAHGSINKRKNSVKVHNVHDKKERNDAVIDTCSREERKDIIDQVWPCNTAKDSSAFIAALLSMGTCAHLRSQTVFS